tara:strand:- start:13437 stop:14258 length:822 start_codon:yes stop_codon:yes gene_type:complete
MALIIAGQTTISIDTVYQRVLALANKEQRGYITPQEFNLHANQAQLDIFEQYFYDLAAATALNKRDEQQQSPGANVEMAPDFGDTVNILREKISIYEGSTVSLAYSAANGSFTMPALSSTIYRTGRMFYAATGGGSIPLKRIEYYALSQLKEEWDARTNSRWHSNPDPAEHYYTENTDGTYSLYKEDTGTTPLTSGLKIEVVTEVPREVKWAYVVVNEKALYDASNSTDFNLHRSEETNLVIKILELAGITINKPGLVQIASNEESQNTQQTK